MKKNVLIVVMMAVLLMTGCSKNTDVEPNQKVEEVLQTDGNNLNVAKQAVLDALKDENWVKNNVSMKQTCFGDPFIGEQELTFEMLKDDLAIVQAFSYEDNSFGVQIFLVGYKEGSVKVISMPEDVPAHPGHSTFGINKENSILVYNWEQQGELKYTAYKIDNLSFTEIDSIENHDEELLNEFDNKYITHPIDVELNIKNF